MACPTSYGGRARYQHGKFVDDCGGVVNKTLTSGLGLENETIQHLSKELNLPWPLSTLAGYSTGLFTKFQRRNQNGVLEGEGMIPNCLSQLCYDWVLVLARTQGLWSKHQTPRRSNAC
ncbi:hypothetical protein BDV11DRAFT_200887 [Aspergillus similis]